MKDLIERLKVAKGPDGRLNAEIACAVEFTQHRPAKKGDHADVHGVDPESEHIGMIYVPSGFLIADNYTGSINAAMTLVPDGFFITLKFGGMKDRQRDYCHAYLEEDVSGDEFEHNNAHSPALALCIAALQARSTEIDK